MSETKKSIIGGMTILGLSGFICKLVGALYRIPLAWIVGDSGLGVYQLVFPTYNMLLTVSSAGIPVAISHMVSSSLARNDPRSAKRVFRLALSFLVVMGCISTVLMIAFSPQLARRVGDPESALGFMMIAPALVLVCAMSAFRGFMQGQQNMLPTAISQLIEQVGKVVIILPMAYFGMSVSPSFAAAMVLLGNTVAEAVALVYMLLVYRRKKRNFAAVPQNEGATVVSTGSLARQLFSLSVPVALASCIIPLAAFIDSGMILNRLMDAGFSLETGRAMYGRFSGYVISLINVPTALSIAIAMSLVPAISGAITRGDYDGMRRQGGMGLRISFLIGLPCSIGLSMLSKPILAMVYDFQSPEALDMTARLLSLSSLTIVLFTVTQSTEGILQGLRKQRIPMYTLLAGVAVKIFLNYTLIGMPSIHIFGAPIASIACYTISMIPNLYFVHKHAQMKMDWMGTLLKPGAATLGMALVLAAALRFFPEGAIWTCLLILLGIASYASFAIGLGAIRREELMPILNRIVRKNKRTS